MKVTREYYTGFSQYDLNREDKNKATTCVKIAQIAILSCLKNA